jgi:predicted dehydrogenase
MSAMTKPRTIRLGIIMNGVTGRMGTHQHLLRSIVPIVRQGGLACGDGTVILPEPILVGRSGAKLQELAASAGITRWSTSLDTVLGDAQYSVYFDAQVTSQRPAGVRAAIAAGKHVYCEKPTALTASEAYELYRLARGAGICHGVVQDKLWLPGLLRYRTLREQGVLGRLLSVRGEFGYWVFEGGAVAPQRPSWNYRAEDGGGIVTDMFCHWRYVLDNLFGRVRAVFCEGATLIPERRDEQDRPFCCTADDTAYSLFRLDAGVVAQFYSSWATRVHRRDLLSIQADGTEGSAIITLRDCWFQSRATTPRAVWNPDVEDPNDYLSGWSRLPAENTTNAFRAQWELFLRHVVCREPFPWGLLEAARGVQLAELGIESWRRGGWVEVPELPEGTE